MVEKAPIVKEYKRAGTFLGARGTRVLRLVTTFLTLGICVYSIWYAGAGFYCLMYVPFDESHGENVFSPVGCSWILLLLDKKMVLCEEKWVFRSCSSWAFWNGRQEVWRIAVYNPLRVSCLFQSRFVLFLYLFFHYPSLTLSELISYVSNKQLTRLSPFPPEFHPSHQNCHSSCNLEQATFPSPQSASQTWRGLQP